MEQDQEAILRQLRKYEQRTLRQLSENIAIPRNRLKQALSELESKGVLKLSGSGRTAVYSLKQVSG